MIYEELKNFLTMAASPEVVRTFDDAAAVFDKYGMTDFMDMFDAVTFDDPDANDAAVLDSLQRNLRTVLEHLLNMQGLHVAEQVLTSQVAEIADAMFMLPDYEDQVLIEQLLAAEFDPQELACELITLLTPYSADELMAFFTQVDESFAESLKIRLSLTTGEVEAPSLELKKQVDAYAAYKGVIGADPIYPDRILAEPAAIGLPYLTYLNLYQADVEGSDLARKEAGAIAKDLVGMAYLSSDGVDAPLVIVRKHLNDLFGDINVVTKINIAVSNLTVEVSHAQA